MALLYELITDEDYDSLPEDPEDRFVALERICRRNMNELVHEDDRGEYISLIQMQYMTTVAAAATELGVGGVEYPDQSERPWNEIDSFLLAVSGATTRIRLRGTVKNRATSVRLSARSRAKIELQINRLREAIEKAEDLPPRRREDLLKKLDELSLELTQPRIRFGVVMAALAFVAVGVGETTNFLANAPDAIATITSIIGADKEAEEAEAERLGSPHLPKALPAPSHKKERPATVILKPDDDIPF